MCACVPLRFFSIPSCAQLSVGALKFFERTAESIMWFEVPQLMQQLEWLIKNVRVCAA